MQYQVPSEFRGELEIHRLWATKTDNLQHLTMSDILGLDRTKLSVLVIFCFPWLLQHVCSSSLDSVPPSCRICLAGFEGV